MVNGCVGSLTEPVRGKGIAVKGHVGFVAKLVNRAHRLATAGWTPQFRQHDEYLVNAKEDATGREETSR